MKPTPLPPPTTNVPLIAKGAPKSALTQEKWGLLPGLVGNWTSAPGGCSPGYNVMPLPASNKQPEGFILKNFDYYEEMTIEALAANPASTPGNAPNRGGVGPGGAQFQQGAYPLFYAQRVYISAPKTPHDNVLIHAENGSWLHLVYEEQPAREYAPPFDGPVPPGEVQPAATEYVKQVSVPHGNTIQAVGHGLSAQLNDPVYPKADRGVEPYLSSPDTVDPADRLASYAADLKDQGLIITSFDQISVSTVNPGGGVSNIQFEKGHSEVTRFDTDFWVLSLSDGSTRLQYLQTIYLRMLVNGSMKDFLHITANSLTPAN